MEHAERRAREEAHLRKLLRARFPAITKFFADVVEEGAKEIEIGKQHEGLWVCSPWVWGVALEVFAERWAEMRQEDTDGQV